MLGGIAIRDVRLPRRTPHDEQAMSRPIPYRLVVALGRRYLPAWGLLGLVVFLVQSVLAAMLHDRDDLRIFLNMLDRLPGFFKALIGGDDLMSGSVSSVVAIGYQHPLVLVCLLVSASMVATGTLAHEVERGTMELLLARPVTRGRVHAIAVFLTVLGQTALVSILPVATTIWTNVFDYGQPVPLVPFFRLALNLWALQMTVAGIAILASSWFDETARALSVVIGFLVSTYLLHFSAIFWPRLGFVRPFTPFSYYQPNAVLKAGAIPWGDVAALVGAGATCMLLGAYVWRRKDLPAA